MSDKKKAAVKKPRMVRVLIPKSMVSSDEKNVFVGVNGKGYQIPVDKETLVPEPVAYALRRAKIAIQQRDVLIAKLTETAKTAE